METLGRIMQALGSGDSLLIN